MKVLITGGYGLLGQYVAERLLQSGHQLVLTSRLPRQEVRPGVEVRSLDVRTGDGLDGLPAVNAVVHAAALTPGASEESSGFSELMNTNAAGTLRMLNWARERAVGTFVYCSSMAVYGPPASLPVGENSPAYPEGRACAYGLSKLAGEALAENHRKQFGARIFSLRFSTLYGRGTKAGEVLPLFVARARAGEPLRVAQGASADFLNARDAARAVELALESQSAGGIFNVGSGTETTILALAEAVCELLGKSPGDLIQVNPEGQGRRFWLDTSLALREIGYQPQYSLRAGLADWLKEERP